MTDRRLLLCTDLDRTLLPNGKAAESPRARPAFRAFAARPEVALAYVTGRNLALVHEACREFALPLPDFLISDVGTRIYEKLGGRMVPCPSWQSEIARDWGEQDSASLARQFADLAALQLQDAAHQNSHKLSYTHSLDADIGALDRELRRRLAQASVRANLIWSVDDITEQGLLDVLPARASKRHAIEFLLEWLGFAPNEVLFAGDSGNDISVLASAIPAVLVANASDAVRVAARREAAELGHADALHCATGELVAGLDGNYAAGILEGVLAYHPDWRDLIKA